MRVLKLFKTIRILAENFPASRNFAENSNPRQNTANTNISRIFDFVGFILKNYDQVSTAEGCYSKSQNVHDATQTYRVTLTASKQLT